MDAIARNLQKFPLTSTVAHLTLQGFRDFTSKIYIERQDNTLGVHVLPYRNILPENTASSILSLPGFPDFLA